MEFQKFFLGLVKYIPDMNPYVAAISFGNRNDLPLAIKEYNAKANKFQTGLNTIELKHKDFFMQNNISMGVETVDNIADCTITLKSLDENLPEEIQRDIIDLFNTTWSQ